MRHLIAILALLALATPAAAQFTYIGGSAVFDIARFDKVEFDDDLRRLTGTATSADGEAVGFNGRIGRALGERWGLEFELARSGSIENRVSFGVPFFANFALLPPELAILPIPDFQYEIESEQRFMSYGTWAWLRQDVGERIDVTFLGGLMFNRAEFEQDVRVSDPRLAQWISIVPNMTATEYSISPAAGVEAGFKVSDAAAITAGFRLHGVTAGRTGLLLRPSVGLRWSF